MGNRVCSTVAVVLLAITAACGSPLDVADAADAVATPMAVAAPSTPSAVRSGEALVIAPAVPSTSLSPAPASQASSTGPAAARDTPPPVDAPPRSIVAAAVIAAPVVDGPRSVAMARGDGTRRCVALTFDAGADGGRTTAVLDTLAAEHITASFGVTGQWAEANPALLRRMVADGHLLINHTYSHASFTGLSTGAQPLTRAQRWAELDRTEAIIERITGVSSRPYFRPPYGDLDASVLADVGARGYAVTAMWSVDSLGWNGLPGPQITDRVLRLATPGAILIFHVGEASADAQALPAIVGGLRTRGYDFVSVAGLIAPAPAVAQ